MNYRTNMFVKLLSIRKNKQNYWENNAGYIFCNCQWNDHGAMIIHWYVLHMIKMKTLTWNEWKNENP